MDDITIIEKGNCSNSNSLEFQLKEKCLREDAKKAIQLIESLVIPDDLKDGLSFLDLKNDTLISYMIELCNILGAKAKGDSIEGHQSIARSVEYRVVLEKIKGINQKLNYQINRLLTASAEEEKMDINNFDIEEDENERSETAVYKPPKLRSAGSQKRKYHEMYADDDEDDESDSD